MMDHDDFDTREPRPAPRSISTAPMVGQPSDFGGLAAMRSELEDAQSAEIQWVGEVGSDEHLAVTGDVLRAREALVKAGGAL